MQSDITDETFHDFTTSTAWERFSADVESVLLSWQEDAAAGTVGDRQATITHRMAFRREPYHFFLMWEPESDAGGEQGRAAMLHRRRARRSLQRWFGVGTYVLLAPDSFTQRVHDDQEASTLMSALAVALSSSRTPWPAFIPLHSIYRQRYIGIRTGKVPQFFESESTQSATVPTSLQRVEGHLKMFAEALAQHAPSASLAALDLLAGRPTAPHAFFVTFGLRLRLPASAPAAEAQGEPAAEWDEGAPWRAWASPADPLADVMLELLWPRLPPDPALSALHRPPADAAVWTLEALAAPANRNLPGAAVSLADGAPGGRRPTVGGFAEMLQHLAEAGRHARAACSIGDLAEDYWQRAGLSPPRSPPERVMQRVLSDIFDVAGGSGQDSGASAGARRGLSVERSAPPGSLLARLALHSLVFANARAVGQLWLRFVQELRFRHWDAGRPLPRTGAPEAPDVSCCLLHQKLQMLDICIRELSSDRCRDHPTEDTFGTDAWPEWGWVDGLAPPPPLLKQPSSPFCLPHRPTPASGISLVGLWTIPERLSGTAACRNRCVERRRPLPLAEEGPRPLFRTVFPGRAPVHSPTSRQTPLSPGPEAAAAAPPASLVPILPTLGRDPRRGGGNAWLPLRDGPNRRPPHHRNARARTHAHRDVPLAGVGGRGLPQLQQRGGRLGRRRESRPGASPRRRRAAPGAPPRGRARPPAQHSAPPAPARPHRGHAGGARRHPSDPRPPPPELPVPSSNGWARGRDNPRPSPQRRGRSTGSSFGSAGSSSSAT